MMKNFQTVHADPSSSELSFLNIAAQEAARSGNSSRVELYRRLGVSLQTIAQTLGASDNYEYAQHLVAQNPQQPALIQSLISGALRANNQAFIERLVSDAGSQDVDCIYSPKSPRDGLVAYPNTLFSKRNRQERLWRDEEQVALSRAASELILHRKSTKDGEQQRRIASRVKFYRALGVELGSLPARNPLAQPSMQNPLAIKKR